MITKYNKKEKQTQEKWKNKENNWKKLCKFNNNKKEKKTQKKTIKHV